MISTLTAVAAKRRRAVAVLLLLLVPASLTAVNDLSAQGNEAGRFPVGVLSSKGSVQLDGRVDWGQSGRSLLPMIYGGTRIKLKNDSAELDLLMGGSIKLCQDTDLTVQQHRSPFLFTLQRGTISFDLPQSQGDVFLTPDFLIKIDPGPELQPRHYQGEIRLEPDGTICVRSQEGLLIVTTQDNSENIVVTAGAGMRIPPGQIGSPEHVQDCSCLDPIPSREGKGLSSAAYQTDGSPQKSRWRSFLRKLIQILTLGIL